MDDLTLIKRHIEPDLLRPNPQHARLREFGVPVWALIGHLPVVNGDIDRLAADYALPREAVEAALAYYRCNRQAIDARLAANDIEAA